jgi:hypothetical protein
MLRKGSLKLGSSRKYNANEGLDNSELNVHQPDQKPTKSVVFADNIESSPFKAQPALPSPIHSDGHKDSAQREYDDSHHSQETTEKKTTLEKQTTLVETKIAVSENNRQSSSSSSKEPPSITTPPLSTKKDPAPSKQPSFNDLTNTEVLPGRQYSRRV